MAVASNELPRFSLLSGATGVYARGRSKEIEGELARCLSGDFTCEAWLQIRTANDRQVGEAATQRHGCWWIHTPSWACGVTTDPAIVLFCDGNWYVSGWELQNRRWSHIAVSRRVHTKVCELLINGEPISLELLKDPDRLRLPVSPSMGFCIGWSPIAESPSCLLLHEMRLWSANLPASAVQRSMSTSITSEHASANHLVAHWSFSSDALSPPEYDLSGCGHDLTIENVGPHYWLQTTPPNFRRSTPLEVARIITLQDTSSEREIETSRFVIELEVLPQADTCVTFQRVTVVLVLNFLCFPEPSLTTKGKGAGLIQSLQDFLQMLPATFQLAICDPSSHLNGITSSLLLCTTLEDAGKTRARNALHKIVIKNVLGAEDLVHSTVKCVDEVKMMLRPDENEGHSLVTVLVVTESTFGESDQALTNAVENIQTGHATVTTNVIQVGSAHSTPDRATMSPLVNQFGHCENNFEWVLAVILSRMQGVVLAGGEFVLEAVGTARFCFTAESSPVFERYLATGLHTRIVIPIGSCSRSDQLNLAGIADFTAGAKEDPLLIAVTFSYFTHDGRKHTARGSLRPTGDSTNHYRIEYTERNMRLRITEDEAQLLEQRRALMRKKTAFIGAFVSQEIADAENTFKKINIMKEELWARRKWIVGRSLRLLDEMELQQVCHEVEGAKADFTRRIEALSAAGISRGSDSRGASRGKARTTSTLRRIHLDLEPGPSEGVADASDDDEGHETNELRLHKVSVKLSVQTKALAEHESKMEDLFISVRFAEARGPVIINDTRRSWIVRFHDMMKSKSEVSELTLTKDYLERLLAFHEDRLVTRHEVGAEMQSSNSALARLENELSKRRKHALLCAKEIVGNVVDEFEASGRVNAAKRDLARSRLMKTLALTQDMYVSCVYICFPIDISELEVPAKTPARNFTNLAHCICTGLRHMCESSSESPVCRRLSFGETFLWWGVEQQTVDSAQDTHCIEHRRCVQEASWAVILVSYNVLFSSAAAMAEVKAVLATARKQAKPIFHIQLEAPLEGLQAFRLHWAGRTACGTQSAMPPVEREFLTWKQNLASFQALLNSVEGVESVLAPNRLDRCHHLETNQDWYYPCLECVWPAIASSYQKTVDEEVEATGRRQDNEYERWFLRVVTHIGSWVDGIASVSLQTAPRSYHVDPNAVCVLSRACEASLQDRVRQTTAKWNEACGRRTKEIQRQMEKLFKVYEEDAHDVVVLRFKLFKRKKEVLGNMSDRLSQLIDEKMLLETWLLQLGESEHSSECGRQRQQHEQMVSEELWQQMQHSESVTARLEALDDLSEAPSEEEIARLKMALDAALRRSTRATLDLGRTHIEDQYRSLARMFKQKELANHIKIAQAKCDEQQLQIGRMERVFEEAERFLNALHEERSALVVEDATAFFRASCLEVRAIPSSTNQDGDHDQLRTLANDLEFHSSFSAAIKSQVLQAHLASSIATEFRTKVRAATAAFAELYSPSIGEAIGKLTASLPITAAGFKDLCQFYPEEPAKTWVSLLSMQALIDKEALQEREVKRVWCEWQNRFIDHLMTSHTQRWWAQCHIQLRTTYERLDDGKSFLAKSFQLRCASERDFQDAVANRERLGHRLAILQRQLMETKQRQQSLLQLLQIARACYETSTIVKDSKLQNVKTDEMFKTWSRVSDYHVGFVGRLFDWRMQCSDQLDELEDDIKKCLQSVASCDTIVACKRQAWLKHSIADNMECTRAEGQQQLAHRTLELIQSLERQRVFAQFRVLDPRSLWLKLPTLTKWHDDYVRAYQHQRKTSGGDQRMIGRSGVDDQLVQLSIARLDVIKQEKLRDGLRRKLVVLERMLDQQGELRRIIETEAQIYRSLGHQLTKRVEFLRDQYEASGRSAYLQADMFVKTAFVSSIDRHSAEQAVRESQDQIGDMISSAQQDYLRLEAAACQIAWRMREHIVCENRGERAIHQVQSELSKVEAYLHVLKAKDNDLFELSLQSEVHSLDATTNSEPTPNAMGMDLATGQSIFGFYARDQWLRSCLSQTTALGERIKSLREVLASLMGIRQMPSRPASSEIECADPPPNGQHENGASNSPSYALEEGDDQLAILQDELQNVELMVLLNRFESRRAEKTLEALREAITYRLEHDDAAGESTASGDDRRDLDAVLPVETLQSRMFSIPVYKHDRVLALLRELATRFDPRDVAGNLSEVIFGASLDRNDLKLIFLVQSNARVHEQWQVALVVLFFARLFRRASLKKAATQRHAQASGLTCDKLHALEDRQHAADTIRALGQSQLRQACVERSTDAASASGWIRALVQLVVIDAESDCSADHLQRVALGILMQQPLHRALVSVMPDAATAVGRIADELEQRRALAEHRPPKPTLLQVVTKDRYTIKIEWKPVAIDHDLLYVAEICDHEPDHSPTTGDYNLAKRFWTQFLTTEKISHTFFNLHAGHSYWIRVRSGFSRTRLGVPCFPLLVTTLSEATAL